MPLGGPEYEKSLLLLLMPPFPRTERGGPGDLTTSWWLEQVVGVETLDGKDSINNRSGVLCGSRIQPGPHPDPTPLKILGGTARAGRYQEVRGGEGGEGDGMDTP